MQHAVPDAGAANDINHIEYILFGVFGLIIATFLAIDLGLLNRQAKTITTRSALVQSIFWVLLSIVFGIAIYFMDGANHALEYYTAYLTEYALSVDNIFVIILILRYFKVEEQFYHKVLFWGIFGALVMRAMFIFLGGLIIHEFHWVLYIFGVFLVYTGVKMLVSKGDDDEINEEDNKLLKFARRFLPFTNHQEGGEFYIRRGGKLYFTPLFLVILLIESTDLLFAVDSIPAAFGITVNEFIIYTSNIFAVMGLRAMFFLLSGVLDKFYLLKKGLSFVLIFIGIKMSLGILNLVNALLSLGLNPAPEIPIGISLVVIILTLGGSIIASIIWPKPEEEARVEAD
jgi:tellurite resistance protein TerC